MQPYVMRDDWQIEYDACYNRSKYSYLPLVIDRFIFGFSKWPFPMLVQIFKKIWIFNVIFIYIEANSLLTNSNFNVNLFFY